MLENWENLFYSEVVPTGARFR